MKVLVIGGNRYVGKRLVNSLCEQGLHVDVLNRGNLAIHPLVKKHFQVDRREENELASSVSGHSWDLIIDFACYTADDAASACRVFKDKTKRYISISTVSVYHYGKGLREEDAGNSDSDYGIKKFQAESEFLAHASWPVTLVRFPIILGPDDYTRRLEFHIDRIQNELPIFFDSLEARISFVHAEDAHQVLEFLIQHPFNGPLNCASADPVKVGQIVTWIENKTQKKLIRADIETKENASPFGNEEDCWIDTSRITHLGFNFQELRQWLPRLIELA